MIWCCLCCYNEFSCHILLSLHGCLSSVALVFFSIVGVSWILSQTVKDYLLVAMVGSSRRERLALLFVLVLFKGM